MLKLNSASSHLYIETKLLSNSQAFVNIVARLSLDTPVFVM